MAKRWKPDSLAEHARAYGWLVWHADACAFIAARDSEWHETVTAFWEEGKRLRSARILEGAEPRRTDKGRREQKLPVSKVAKFIEDNPGEFWD